MSNGHLLNLNIDSATVIAVEGTSATITTRPFADSHHYTGQGPSVTVMFIGNTMGEIQSLGPLVTLLAGKHATTPAALNLENAAMTIALVRAAFEAEGYGGELGALIEAKMEMARPRVVRANVG
jgi:hypothetical protein